ncbi:hypothetical protein WA026_015450 [Henosepilachna vigintioctopunctata]|uniref:Ionotropic receptor n=1 Tax=Henosepilachna vigintioctopunctata TaxID=420089 RepID=A0AAW1UPE4_9CUCU
MMTVVIWCLFSFLLLISSRCIAKIIIERTEFKDSSISILTRFVNHYNNHSFILHNDALSAINVAQLVDILPTYRIIGENGSHIKPIAKEAVNIFFIQNVSESMSGHLNSRVFNEDGCNLFVTNEAPREICYLEAVNLAPASFVLDLKNDQLFSCFTQNEELDITPVTQEEFNSLKIYHRSFSDLGGKTMKIYFLNTQVTLCRQVAIFIIFNDYYFRLSEYEGLEFGTFINGFIDTVPNGTCNPEGAEADIVRTLGKKFNFKPEFWVFEYKNQSRRWSEMIDAVGREEAEFALGSIVVGEDGIVYYTSFIQSSAEFAIFYVNPTKELNLSKILMSFDLIVYIIAFSSLIFIVILTMTFTHLFNYGFENGRFIFILIKMVIEQGSNLSSGLYSFITMKLILALWLYFTIIFCTVLKSQIASILIKPETYDCRTVEDLQNIGFVFLIPDIDRFRSNAKYDGMTLNTYQIELPIHYHDYEEICPLSRDLFKYRFATVFSEFDLLVEITMCMKYFPRTKINDIRLFKENSIYHSFAMNPASPYKKQFDININLLKSSGIINHWYDYLNKDLMGKLTKENAPPRPFKIKEVYNFFVLLLVGLGIGFVVLILEIIHAALVRRYNIMK